MTKLIRFGIILFTMLSYFTILLKFIQQFHNTDIQTVKAGFPSPAEDFSENSLDLNRLIIKHPSSTFFMRVEGDSMRDAGIFDGDIVVVDRAIYPNNGDVIVAAFRGELLIKKLRFYENKIFLVPCNQNYAPVEIKNGDNFEIWGTVTFIIRNLK